MQHLEGSGTPVLYIGRKVLNTLPSGHAEMRDYCPMRC